MSWREKATLAEDQSAGWRDRATPVDNPSGPSLRETTPETARSSAYFESDPVTRENPRDMRPESMRAVRDASRYADAVAHSEDMERAAAGQARVSIRGLGEPENYATRVFAKTGQLGGDYFSGIARSAIAFSDAWQDRFGEAPGDETVRNFLADIAQRGELVSAATVEGAPTWEATKENPWLYPSLIAHEAPSAAIYGGLVASGLGMGATGISFTGNIGQERAQNDGRLEATATDAVTAAPFAAASLATERLGARYLGFLGDKISGGVGTRILKGAVGEAGTEAGQNVIENFGGSVGTERGVNLAEMRDQALAGAAIGFGTGGAIRGGVETVAAAENAIRARRAARAATTPDDQASPLDTKLLEDGRASQIEAELNQEQKTDVNLPPVGERVAVTLPGADAPIEATYAETMNDESGAGVVLKLDNGQEIRAYFDEIEADGVKIEPAPQAQQQQQQPGKPEPVEDGTAVIRSIFGERARVTSGYRGPDHPLSQANPNSYHAQTRAAVDMAPISGMTFDEAKEQIEAQGYTLIEALNEVGEGRTANATGDHWHFVIGTGAAGAASTAAETNAEPFEAQGLDLTERETIGARIPLRVEEESDTAVVPATLQEVPVRYALAELDDLVPSNLADGRINPSFPAERQPRDRTRAASQNQVRQISTRLYPKLLARDVKTSDGAPIVDAMGVVDSGNGRVMALTQAYEANDGNVESYKQMLEDEGFDATGMNKPVLVRVRDDMAPEDVAKFVRDSNARSTASMSGVETAASDAAALPASLLSLYKGGDLDTLANSDFVKGFAQAFLPASEVGAMVMKDGRPNANLLRRIDAALLVRALGPQSFVEWIVDARGGKIKSLGNALIEVSGKLAQLREAAAQGIVDPSVDISDNIAEAVTVIDRARRENRDVAEFVNQVDAFSGDMNPITVAILRIIYKDDGFKSQVSQVKLVDALTFYIDEAMKAAPGGGLIASPQDVASDILELTNARQSDPNARPAPKQPDAKQGEIGSLVDIGGDVRAPSEPSGEREGEGLQERPSQEGSSESVAPGAAQLDEQSQAELEAEMRRQTDFEQAKAKYERLNAEVTRTSKALQVFPKGQMGLTPDEVKSSPEFQKAKRDFDDANQVAREYNAAYNKRWSKEIAAERAVLRTEAKDAGPRLETERSSSPTQPGTIEQIPGKSTLKQAYSQGWNAAEFGWSVDDNPYLETSRMWEEWRKGFKSSDKVETPQVRAVREEEGIAPNDSREATSTAPEHADLGATDAELEDVVVSFKDRLASMGEGDQKVSHVFDPPAKGEIVRLANKAKVFNEQRGGWMTVEEAKREIAKWKANAQKQGLNRETASKNSDKVVLSLFDLSGEWSKPWREAGYDVWQFDIQTDPTVGNVNNFSTDFFGDWFGDFEGKDIHAILAACPCTDFASSGARHFAAKDKDGRTVSSVELVNQTLATIEYFKPAVWALENPVGRIEKLGGLPPWRLSFDPNHIGEPYTKKTLIWGRFNADMPITPVEPTEGSKMWAKYGGKSLATKNARSVTPEGFAYSFFQANNAIDNPVVAMANKYDRLDRDLIEQAVKDGVSEQDLSDAVDDPYYIELDDAAAEQAIRGLIEGGAPTPTPTPAESKSYSIEDTPSGKGIAVTYSSTEQLEQVERLLPKAKGAKRADGAYTYSKKHRANIENVLESMGAKDAKAEKAEKANNAENTISASAGPRVIVNELNMADEVVRQANEIDLPKIEGATYRIVKGREAYDLERVERDGSNILSRLAPADSSAEVVQKAVKSAIATARSDAAAQSKPGQKSTDEIKVRDTRKSTDDEKRGAPDDRMDYTSIGETSSKVVRGFGATAEKAEADARRRLADQKSTRDSREAGRQAFRVGDNKYGPRPPWSNQNEFYAGYDEAKAEASATKPTTVAGKGVIGQNERGQDVFEDERGVRSYVESGIRVTESVGIVPGGGFSIDLDRRGSEFKTVSELGQERAEQEKQQPSDNRLVSDDRAAELRKRLREKLNPNRLNAGIDPETLAIGAELAVYHIEKGARKFIAMSKAIASDLGMTPAQLRQYLRGWYNGARDMMEDAGQQIDGMDDADSVRALLGSVDEWGATIPAEFATQGQENNDADLQDGLSDGNEPAGTGNVSGASQDRGDRGARGSQDRGSTGTVSDPDGRSGADQERDDRGSADSQNRDRSGVRNPDGVSGEGNRDSVKGKNWYIEPGSLAENRSPAQKARDNIDAIELVKAIKESGRPAFRLEQERIAKYVGWGGLKNAFPDAQGNYGKGFEEIGPRLRELLTDEEYETANRSIQYAHYTAEPVVGAMWKIARRLGFNGGTVFEPGMGTGNFLGLMPQGVAGRSQYSGLEFDGLTADIAKLLYPESGVRHADYTKTPRMVDAVDLVIGNPPFSSTVVAGDKDYGHLKFVLHDFFFAKSLDAVKPGGLLMFVTSAGTMNKKGEKARAWLADRADLVGAIRLPGNAFKQNAGTEVTTDIVILRKRAEGEQPGDASWIETVSVPMKDRDGNTVEGNVNRYFVENPQMVLGEQGMFDKLTPRPRYAVRAPADFDMVEAMGQAMDSLPRDILAPTAREEGHRPADVDLTSNEKKDGSFYIGDDKRLMVYRDGVGKPVETRGKGVKGGFTKAAQERIRKLIPVRDALRSVYAADIAEDAAAAKKARAELNKFYDAFVKKFGPINLTNVIYRKHSRVAIEGKRAQAREDARLAGREWDDGSFDLAPYLERGASLAEIAKDRDEARAAAKARKETWDEGSFDPDEVAENPRATYPNIEAFLASDEEGYRLAAIESYNPETGQAKKGLVFERSVVRLEKQPEINGTQDALFHSLNARGRPDIDLIAELSGKSPDAVLDDLKEQIFAVPNQPGEYQTADRYLSGNVREKLAEAEEAAKTDSAYRPNVTALERALPRPLTQSEVAANLGMPWIPPKVVEQFATEKMGLKRARVRYTQALAEWTAIGDDSSAAARSLWGAGGKSALDLMEYALNRRQLKIYNTMSDGSRVFNEVATSAANAKLDEMKDAFAEWVYSDSERASELVDFYNREFNSSVAPKFTGDYLTMPGLNAAWALRPHQSSVVARILQTGNTYMAHEVGAGKTSASISAGMEMKRLGMISKPMYVVPNHMLGQFSKEFYEQYPLAKIRVADEKRFHTSTRKQFIAQVAADDLDAIIITHSSFKKVSVSDDFMSEMLEAQIAELAKQQSEIDPSERVTRAKMERQKEALEQRLRGLARKKSDQVFTFEEMGVDFLFVDEAHEFRKLDFSTKMGDVKGVDPNGSQASFDLFAKVQYLEGNRPGRSVVLMSGTPITNTMAELYSLQKYLQLGELKKRGLDHFDAWAGAFGETVTELEQDPAGGYKAQTRFAKFVNVPELSVMARQVMDVVTGAQLREFVTLPEIKGGERQMVVAEQTPGQKAYQQVLGQRMEAIKRRSGPPKKGDDILLSVIGDGRKNAIDARLIDPSSPKDPDSKLEKMIENVARTYKETRTAPFHKPEKGGFSEKPVERGPATQMIFSDFGINGEFPVHKYIKNELIQRGIPSKQVAIISDYKSHVAKQRLFNDMNEGKVRVLIGSVAKMGTGVNAQQRLIASHNMDPQWFPANDTQRNGRIVRQGNMNPEIEIYDYSTKGTYDSQMWKLMAKKARFIEGFMRGDPDMREMEDLGEAGQYEQAQALTTSDPRILELTEFKQERDKINLRKLSAERKEEEAKQTIKRANVRVAEADAELASIEKDIALAKANATEEFEAIAGGTTYAKRDDFGAALIEAAGKVLETAVSKAERLREGVGEFRGFPIVVEARPTLGDWAVTFIVKLSDGRESKVDMSESASGQAMRIENIIRAFEQDKISTQNYRRIYADEIKEFSGLEFQPFDDGGRTAELTARINEIEKALAGETKAADAAAAKEALEFTAEELRAGFKILAPGEADPRIDAAVSKPVEEWTVASPGMFSVGSGSTRAEAMAAFRRWQDEQDSLESRADGPDLFDAPTQPERSMTQAQRAELEARQKQGKARRGGQQGLGDQEGGLFSSERDQGSLFLRTEAGEPITDKQAKDLEADLRKRLDAMGLSRVNLRVPTRQQMAPTSTRPPDGRYHPSLKLIEVASNAINGSTFTLDHEAIHALRDLGAFNKTDWKLLENAAWRDSAIRESVERRYPGLAPEAQKEEAVADYFADHQSFNEKYPKTRAVVRVIKRALDILRAIRSALRGQGFVADRKPIDVLDDIESGRIAQDIGMFDQGNAINKRSEPDGSGLASVESRPVQNLAALGGTDPTWKGKTAQAFEAVRTRMQDRYLPLLSAQRVIEKMTGGPLDNSSNPYLGEELLAGRIGARLEKLHENTIGPLFDDMARSKITSDELESFLYARHAPERNARMQSINPDLGYGEGSGMTDIEAAAIMNRAQSSGKLQDLERLADQVDVMRDDALDYRIRMGLISQKQADDWRATYDYYVPLRGFAEVQDDLSPETQDRINRSGGGINVRGPESKRAFGRRSEADSPLAYLILQAEEAIVRGETNRVAQRFLKLARDNPDDDFWKVNKVTQAQRFNDESGQVESYVHHNLTAADKDWTIVAKENGKEVRVTLNKQNPGARQLAKSMRNLTGSRFELINATLGRINRYLSTVNTSYNPEFIVSNMVRDLQTAAINLQGIDVDGIAAGTGKHYFGALAAATKGSWGKGSGDWKKWYDEFILAGGRVYFNNVEDIGQIRKRIESSFEMANAKAGNEKAARVHIKRGLLGVRDAIESTNLGVENGVRLAAYRAAREAGVDQDKAASIAKNLTVNFNRRGEWGPVMNGFYLFYNASVQGSVRLLAAAKSPRVRKILGAAIVAGALNEVLNMMVSDDDEDGQSFYDKIPAWEKSRNMIFMLPGGDGSYIKIPLPYGYGAIYETGRTVAEITRRGGDRWKESSGNLFSTFVDSFNPVGGAASLTSLLAPTIVDPIVDLELRNKDFADRPIMPNENPYGVPEPDSQRYFNSVSPYWKAITDTLNDVTGGSKVEPGAIDVSPETLEYLNGFVFGAAGSFVDRVMSTPGKLMSGDIESNDVIFTRKVFGGEPGWLNKGMYYDRIAEVERVETYVKRYVNDENPEAAREFAEDNRAVLELVPAMKEAQKLMRQVRKERDAVRFEYEKDRLTDEEYRARIDRVREVEEQIVTAFNTRWNKALTPDD